MTPKTRTAIDKTLAAEAVYTPYLGKGEGVEWRETLEAMEKLRRAVQAARKALESETPK
jgi:hypothetical protein